MGGETQWYSRMEYFQTVWGTVLRENRGMRALGKKLGFTAQNGEASDEVELTIDLKTADLSFLG